MMALMGTSPGDELQSGVTVVLAVSQKRELLEEYAAYLSAEANKWTTAINLTPFRWASAGIFSHFEIKPILFLEDFDAAWTNTELPT